MHAGDVFMRDKERRHRQARGWVCQLGQLAWVSPWAMLGQNSGLVDGFTWAYFQKNGLGLKGKDLKGVKGRNE